jgi:hypothetical protein
VLSVRQCVSACPSPCPSREVLTLCMCSVPLHAALASPSSMSPSALGASDGAVDQGERMHESHVQSQSYYCCTACMGMAICYSDLMCVYARAECGVAPFFMYWYVNRRVPVFVSLESSQLTREGIICLYTRAANLHATEVRYHMCYDPHIVSMDAFSPSCMRTHA